MALYGICGTRLADQGLGCTRFGQRWDKGFDDLVIEAAEDTFASAGATSYDVDAYRDRHRPRAA